MCPYIKYFDRKVITYLKQDFKVNVFHMDKKWTFWAVYLNGTQMEVPRNDTTPSADQLARFLHRDPPHLVGQAEYENWVT